MPTRQNMENRFVRPIDECISEINAAPSAGASDATAVDGAQVSACLALLYWHQMLPIAWQEAAYYQYG